MQYTPMHLHIPAIPIHLMNGKAARKPQNHPHQAGKVSAAAVGTLGCNGRCPELHQQERCRQIQGETQ
jgi:hypothetical protein